MLIKTTKIKLVINLIGFMVLFGCTTTKYGATLDSSTVKIETIRSRIADIRQVTVYQQKEGYLVRGNVTRNSYIRGHISGHVDFELLNSKGETTFKATKGYRHKGLRFKSEDFSLKIDKPINKGSVLRIAHIESRRHVESK